MFFVSLQAVWEFTIAWGAYKANADYANYDNYENNEKQDIQWTYQN